MKRAAFALLLLVACTEPRADYFEGAVASTFVTGRDIFALVPPTVQMTVVKSSTDVCQQADVTVTQSTAIFRLTSPAVRLPFDSLKTGVVVRVASGTSVKDICPMLIQATAIGIVK